MGLEQRIGTYGQYWGNTYDSSNALTMDQMKLNALYIWNCLNQQGWTLNAVARNAWKYAKRKHNKSSVDGKVM